MATAGGMWALLTSCYITEIKEIYFEMYTKQVSCPLAFIF